MHARTSLLPPSRENIYFCALMLAARTKCTTLEYFGAMLCREIYILKLYARWALMLATDDSHMLFFHFSNVPS